MPVQVHTKALNRRFTPVAVHDGTSTRSLCNFSSYVRRMAAAFGGDEKISRQGKKLERAAREEIAALKRLGWPSLK